MASGGLKTLRDGVRAGIAFLGDGPYCKRFTVAGRVVKLENRGPTARMGRFGGGWEREAGIQLGRRGFSGTVIVNLWRSSVRIDPRREA